jgi:hypothetical protein
MELDPYAKFRQRSSPQKETTIAGPRYTPPASIRTSPAPPPSPDALSGDTQVGRPSSNRGSPNQRSPSSDRNSDPQGPSESTHVDDPQPSEPIPRPETTDENGCQGDEIENAPQTPHEEEPRDSMTIQRDPEVQARRESDQVSGEEQVERHSSGSSTDTRFPTSTSPGTPRQSEHPGDIEEQADAPSEPQREVAPWGVLDERYRWCVRCERIKPLRTHHCRSCGTCVLKMDREFSSYIPFLFPAGSFTETIPGLDHCRKRG